ncbi:DUF1905 domain-containing protein [Plantibacter sp. YIM 135347]|uniref:DUF1905 domain-containing protein n=1 Tax=Plantibacter sp. YIM 135347 TaxID=3423919 RepID=UPI003D349C9D
MSAATVRFTTVIELQGNNTGIPVPDEVVEGLGAGKRVPLIVTVGGTTYRSSVAPYRGKYMISLSAANRAAAGVEGGDEVEVQITVDDAPREFALPDDLATILAGDTKAAAAYQGLSFSRQRALVEPIDQAKTPETRQRRIEKALETLRGA